MNNDSSWEMFDLFMTVIRDKQDKSSSSSEHTDSVLAAINEIDTACQKLVRSYST